MTFGEALGIGIGIFGIVASEWVPTMHPWQRNAIAAVGTLVLAYSGMLAFQDVIGVRLNPGPLWLIMSGMVLFGCGIFWQLQDGRRKPGIEADFAALAKEFQSKLGPPILEPGRLEKSRLAVQAKHERANILWIDDISTTYYRDYKLENSRHVHDGMEPQPNLTDVEIHRRLKLKPDQNPPRGGVARRWLNDPRNFGWMGGAYWYTRYENGELSYQRFQNGIIAGPIRSEPDRGSGRIFVYFNDASNAWQERGTTSEPAPFRDTR